MTNSGYRKTLVVDTLQNIADGRAALPAGDDVGVVYVALGPRVALNELGHDLKLADQFFKIEPVDLRHAPR